MQIVSGVGNRGGARVGQRPCELVGVLSGEVAALAADDQGRRLDRAPLRPVVASREIRDALHHHRYVKRGLKATGAALEAGDPNVRLKPFGHEELPGLLHGGERGWPPAKPSLCVLLQIGRGTIRGRLDDNQRGEPLRVGGGDEKCGVAAHRLADQDDRGEIQLIDDKSDIRDERLPGELAGVTLASSVAALIERENATGARERICGFDPLAGVPGKPMQEQHSGAAAAEIAARQPRTGALELAPGTGAHGTDGGSLPHGAQAGLGNLHVL